MLAIVVGYVVVQLAIGVWVSRRVKTEGDYLLAGRRLGYSLVMFSVFATWFGAETCVGAASEVYQHGLSGGSADPFGYALCILIMGLFFARTLWKMKLTTVADLYRQRFGPAVERVSVLLMAPTSLLWAAAQIRALGQVLSHSGRFELDLAIAIAAGVAVTYTVFGGLLADAVTDVIQGVVLILGLVVVTVAVVTAAGGPMEAVSRIEPSRFSLLGDAPWLVTLERWAIPVCGSLVAQELIQRILASRSPEVAQRGTLLATGLYLSIGLMPVVIGLLGPSLEPTIDDPEQLLPFLAEKHLPLALAAVFSAALVSAILSTVDTTLLVVGSLVSHNVVALIFPRLSDRRRLLFARLGVVISGIGAYLLALSAESVHGLVEEASAFGSAGIFVVFLMGVTTKVGREASALGALLAGVGAWIVGSYWLELETPFLVSLLGAFLAYFACAWIKSRSAAPRAVPALPPALQK